MLSSIRQSDQKRVYAALIEKNPKESYKCDYCGKETIHHKSKALVRVPHFKHRSKDSSCPNNSPESELHLKTKLDIYSYLLKNYAASFKCIELEKWILNKYIRPDIYIETRKGNKVAIEVQKTKLTPDIICSRTEKYYANDITVLWIMPFEKGRYWKYQQLTRGFSVLDENWEYGYAQSVRLKEMELWLLEANKDKLICWDLEHKDSESFVSISFSDHKSPDREYSIGKEEYYYYGRTSKTLKKVDSIKYDLLFSDFKRSKMNGFKSRKRGYSIPDRYFLISK